MFMLLFSIILFSSLSLSLQTQHEAVEPIVCKPDDSMVQKTTGMELTPVIGTEYYHTVNLWFQGFFPPNPYYESPSLEKGETFRWKAYIMTTVLDRNDTMITFGHILTRLSGNIPNLNIDHFDTATSPIKDLADTEILNGFEDIFGREVKTYRKLDGSLPSDNLFFFEKDMVPLFMTHFMTGNVAFPKKAIEEGMTWTTNLKDKKDELTVTVDRSFEVTDMIGRMSNKKCWDTKFQPESIMLSGKSNLTIAFEADPVPPMYLGSLSVTFEASTHITLGNDGIIKNMIECYEGQLEAPFHDISSTFMRGSLRVELVGKYEPPHMWCGTVPK